VITGLLGGVLATAPANPPTISGTHSSLVAQAGIMAAQEHRELGVDAFTLTEYLIPALREFDPVFK